MKHKTTPRTLFVTASEDSRKAEDLLRSKAIAFSCARVERASSVGYVSENDLPLLITGEGQWEGLAAWTNALKAITEDLTPLSWDELLLLQPDCIVTLIDDIYDIWQRIEQGPHDTHFSLDEILTWRSVEVMNAKTLALNLRLNKSRLKISGKLNIP